ncbi:MAG: GNAT family N-acetyltransferase [Candidatus Helarchaeota archaeon]
MSEIFFAKYYKFYRYRKELKEIDSKFTVPNGFKIKELNPNEDYEKFKSAWLKIYSKILPEPYIKFKKEDLLKYPKTFVLENSNDEIVGFIVCYIKEKEKMGKILRIGVQENYRKKGFGLLLYHKGCEYFLQNKITNIYFDVYEDDLGLSKLAKKASFEKEEEFFITIDDPVENFINLSTIMSL